MSHSYYGRQWGEAQSALVDLLQQELPIEEAKPEKDRFTVFQTVGILYVKYIQIFRKLESCYDQVVQPQKRRVLRHVLDGVMGRVLEIKNEMVNLEYSEFHYFDDILSDLKLIPNDAEIPIPRYFISERTEALKTRQELLNHILSRLGPLDKDLNKTDIRMSGEDAILMIQIHERARQGRLRAKFMREIRQQEIREKLAEKRGVPTLDRDLAAIRVQKVWKGFAQRRKTTREREEELRFIGMTPYPTAGDDKITQQSLALMTEKRRYTAQKENEKKYVEALDAVKTNLKQKEGPDIKENMMDQIRQWFIECRDSTGKFPDFPEDDEGGSAAIFKEMNPGDVEADAKAKSAKRKKSGKKKGKKDKKDKKDKKNKKEKTKVEEEEDAGWKMGPSSFLPNISEATDTYMNVWQPRGDIEDATVQYDVELIKEEKRIEIEAEIRKNVDELMRQELKNLKLAVDRDKGKKGGKKSKSGKRKKAKKSKSGKKGKKGKKEKDLTADRTIESLFEELVVEGIIVQHPQVKLIDFIGEYSYLGTTLRQANIEPMPSLSDVRRLMVAYAILPLGSAMVHENAPLIKSILLAGPKGTGKNMLVHSICTETGANLFNLSSNNISGKYPGKDGAKFLLHMVFKVAKALQPSVIFIDECDKMFAKKKSKTELGDPKKLKKDLPKSLKSIRPEDRVLLIGASNTPFDAEMKPLASCYQKIILIPRPDYASRHLLWRMLIEKNGGQIGSSLDISSLAKITDGYTPGHISFACQQVLTDRRISTLTKKSLQSVEFVAPLARVDPVYKEEEENFKSWYEKTPLGKKRCHAVRGDGDGDAGRGKSAKSAKSGKSSAKKGKGKGKKKKK